MTMMEAELPISKPKRRAGSTRAQKQEATRKKLLHAAAQLIGQHGYAGASIHKITALANIANGTFYNYFNSQQDLFDQLLPALGDEMLDTIREAIRGERNGLNREELGFRAFFDYISANPSFHRILNEGEIFAPTAYRNHMQNMVDGYLRALHAANAKGEIKDFDDRELEIIVYILLSARDYLSYRFFFQNGKVGRLPDWVTHTYMKFVAGGIAATSETRATPLLPLGEERADPFTVEAAGSGSAEVSMQVTDCHLDGTGCISHPAIVMLIDRASVAAIGAATETAVQMVSLSTNFIRVSHARTLVATASLDNVAGRLAHGSVNVHEMAVDGQLVAQGMVVFATGPSLAAT